MFTKSPVYALFLPFQSGDSLILNLWVKRFKAECRAGSGAWNWNKTHHPDTNICIQQIFCTPGLTAVVEQKQTLIIGRRGSWSLHQAFVTLKYKIPKIPLGLKIFNRFLHLFIFSLTLAEYPVLSNVLQDNDFRCSLCSDASFVFHWYFINFMGCSIVHFLLMTYFWYIYFLLFSQMFTFFVKQS